MEQKKVKPYTKEQAKNFAEAVLKSNLECSLKSIKYIGGGSYGFVYLCRLEGEPQRVIMKACRADGMCALEAEALKMLAENSPVPVPKVLFTFNANNEIPLDFICEEFIEGKNCLIPRIFVSKKARCDFANSVTDALLNWHKRTNGKFGLIDNAVYDSWTDYYKPFAYDILKSAREHNKKGNLSDGILNIMEKAWENFDYIFSEPVTDAVLTHGDLNTMNIMADSCLRITGIIDPLESKWADREYDLFQLRNLNGERFNLYETYKSKYPVSEKCDLKCAFYGLYNEIYCNIKVGSFNMLLIKPCLKRMKNELKKAGLL